MELQPYVEGPAGDVIAPYLSADGKTFARDFYMKDRVSAMVGASVREYEEANVILSREGFDALETHVLGPDEPGRYWHEVITTSADAGWNPRGANYFWVEWIGDNQNAANWIACGRPRVNQYGEWADQGVPAELGEWRKSLGNRDPAGGIPFKRGPGRRR